MNEYIHPNGYTYTEDELISSAKKENMTLEEFINNRGIKPKKKKEKVVEEVTTKVPGKKKTVVKEDAVATAKGTASKLVEPSSVSPDNPFGKTKTIDPLGLEKFKTPKKDVIAERIDRWNKTGQSKKSVVGPKDKDYGSLYVKDSNKIGDYLTSTLKTKKAAETFFGVEEEEGKQTLEKLYAGIPGLTFEETNATSGDITNRFDAVKAVYVDPFTGARKESDILQFDIGVMNASAEKRPQLANKNADILKDFFNKNLKNVNLAKNKALREESKLIYNKELNNAITPEFRAEVNAEFDAPNLFAPRKESYAGTNLAGGMTMGTAGGGTYIVRPYENELNSAKKKILLDNPNISKEKLNIEADRLARTLLKTDAFNNKKASVAQNIIDNDKTLQSKLYVGSLLANEAAVKEQNKATTQLKVAENAALTMQGLGKDAVSILNGEYKTEEEAAVIANKFKSVGIDMDVNNTELLTLKNGNTVSKGFYDAYLKLNEAYKANNLYATQAFKAQTNNLEKLNDSDIFTTAAAKNYDLGEKYLANIGLGTADIVTGASYLTAKVLAAVTPFAYAGDEISELIYGEDAQTTSGKLDEWAVGYTKAVEDIRQSYVRDVSFKDAFKDGSNFGKFAAQEISQQIPILMAMMATGGAAGAAGVSAEGASTAMIGTFGAGSKMAQMQTEIAKGTADYSNTEIWLKSIGFGASEALFERVTTIPILKRATNHFAKFGGEDVVDDGIAAYFKSKSPGFVFDQFLESAGETGTAITQNIIDGRPVMENVDHAAFSGFGMGTVMSGVPYAHGLYLSAFSDYNSKQGIRTLHTELKDLGEQFELTKKRAAKKAIAGLMDAKQQEINIAIEKQQSKINENLRSGAAQTIIAIENEKAKLQNEAKSIVDDKSIDSALKEILIKDLRNKFNKLNNIKENALAPANLMQDKSKFILLEANEPTRYNDLIDQATSNLGKKGVTTKETIEKEAYELYLGQEIDTNIANASKVEGMELLSFNTKADIIPFIQSNENIPEDEKANIINEIQKGGDGFNIGNLSVVVKENMLANQRTQIGSHEVGHGVFNAIFKNNPEAFIPVANQLLVTTEKLDKKLYNKLAKNIDKVGDKFDAQEVISRFLESVSSGDISFAEKKNSFLSGLFGSMIQKEFINEYDFDFKGQTDMFNFVVGLGKKIKEGTLTLKEIQEASESSIATAKVNPKDFKNVVLDSGSVSFSKAKVAEVQAKIDALEDQYDNDDIEYDAYENKLTILKDELKAAKAMPEAEVTTEATVVKKEPVKKESITKEPRSKGNLQNLLDTKYDGDQKRLASEGLRNTPSGSVTNDFSKSIIGKELGGTVETITRRLYDPIAADAKRNVTRDEYKDALIQSAALLINNEFDASKQTLDKFISSRLNLRANALAYELGIEGATKGGIKKDAAEEKGLTADETADQGFTETVKEKPKYKNALEAKVFPTEVLETATKKIITILRTIKSRIDAPVSLNKTVTPLISEIRDEVGKQLDIDIKTMLGGKKDGVLRKELLRTKRYILENMTTTWLMGKDGQGGIPQAIQKQIDGKWVNFPDWVGKKIDREKTTTDQAGRTSGAELVRRLPNVANNISDEIFLAQIIGPDGNPIRGRKESLSKAMAEEGAFDIINADLAEEGPIFEALATNQERQGVEIASNFAIDFARQAERGNVKFSKALKEKLAEKLEVNVNDDVVVDTIVEMIQDIIKPTIYKRNKAIRDKEINLRNKLGNDLYEELYDEYLYPIADALESVRIAQAGKRGNVAEDEVIKTLNNVKNKNFKVISVKAAGTGSDAIDVKFSYKDFDINFEVKSGKNDRITSLNIHNYANNKPINTSRSLNDNNKKELLDQIENNKSLNSFIKKAIEGGATFTENGSLEVDQKLLNKLIRGTSLYKRTLIAGKDLNISMDLVADINNRKGINYIGFGDIGIFSIGGNPIGLDVPALEGKLYSKAFLHAGKPKINGKRTLTLKVYTQLTTAASNELVKKSKASIYSPESWNILFSNIPEGRIEYLKNIKDIETNANNINAINAVNFSKAPKGISVFDFDDTVGLTKSNVLYTMPGDQMVYHGAPIGKDVTKISDKGVKFFATDKREADEYARMHSGTTQEFVLNNSQIVDEEIAINKMRELRLTPKNKEFGIDDASFYELIDTRFEESLSKADITKLFNALKKDGIKALSYNDGAQVSGKTTTSIAVIDPSIISKPKKLNGAEFAKEGSRLLEEGAQFDFSEFSKVVDGKPGPMVEKMKKLLGKFGPKDMFILTARPADSAGPIHQFLSSIGIDIPLENITGLGNSTAQAKADWITAKAADGYNDFYFADDHLPNVNAVKYALDVLDVKSKIQQARIKFSKTISPEFNKIIEENTGMADYKVFSDIVARRRGADKNKFDFYVPPSAADFELLLYNFIGKGKRGEEQQKFFADALLKPYANGNDLMDAARQSIKRGYKALTDQFPNIKNKIEKLTPDGDFTYDQAIRVAMWTEEGVDIPGISQRDQKKLTELVNNDPELVVFKQGLIIAGRQGKGWVAPTEFWDASTIISDLHNLTEGEGRKKFLAEFIENAQEMFGKWENGKLVGPNINKVEAVYGTNVREAIEDVLWRMTTGKNRSQGKDKETSMWANWVTGSTGAIMFLNVRSAALQLIGAVNFLNLRDNNPIAAAAAFANQKQYWADFARIWNSDKMKERRGGLKEDVAAAEIANAAAGSKNKVGAVLSYLLKIGYTPTQMADSFAIASGGAPFYRNRIKSYIKGGMTEQEAETAAWEDFTKVSDETQQSGDPRDISKQQASAAGRLLLTFQNTAMQQSRIVKKAILDLKNRRGNDKTNVAKIAYYLAIQNTMFAVLQQGLFAVAFGYDDEDKEKPEKEKKLNEKLVDVTDGVIDTILRGTGFTGGVIATLKNMTKKYLEEKDKKFKADYAKVMLEGANISPPIGSKLRKLYSGLQQTKFESDLIKERGWGVMQDGRVHLGPMYGVSGKLVESFTNVPMDRLVTKIENASQAMNTQNEAWQRVMVGLGWSPYSIGIEESTGDQTIRAKAKEVRKEEGKIKAKETRERTKDSIDALPIAEKMKLRKEKRLKRREEVLKRRRKMG